MCRTGAVRRLAGPVAGLTAAAVLAVTPVTVLLSRGNVSDSLLVLLLVLAADATAAALLSGSLRQLLLAGVWVGLAFQALAFGTDALVCLADDSIQELLQTRSRTRLDIADDDPATGELHLAPSGCVWGRWRFDQHHVEDLEEGEVGIRSHPNAQLPLPLYLGRTPVDRVAHRAATLMVAAAPVGPTAGSRCGPTAGSIRLSSGLGVLWWSLSPSLGASMR